LRIGPFRFFFYSNENGEPAHIQKDRSLAKFWLNPVSLVGSTRFSPKEIRDLKKRVEKNREKLWEAWNEYFTN
jgi:hypothetical protein